MKTIKNLFILTFFIFSFSANAQSKKTEELKIKTSAECGMCKKQIEKAVSFEKGVKKASLDVDSKELTVTYNPQKTSPEKIREAVCSAGYDADDKPANNKAYQKLPECCKKGGDHKHE